MRKLSPEEIDHWVNGLGAMDSHNEILGMCIATTFRPPRTLLDIGSGTGALVNIMRKIGVEAQGVDLLPRHGQPHLIQYDLSEPLYLSSQFDMVTCIETAEHILPSAAETLCDSIARHVAGGGLLIFTAAMPGQVGDGHENCQPAEYWRIRFTNRGLVYQRDMTWRLALAWTIANHPLHHVEANLQVFMR